MTPALKPVADLSADEAAAELQRLARLIAEADKAYYADDRPKLTDAEYDALRRRNALIERQFPKLKRADSPSARVGAAPSTRFEKAAHARPMLSLDNAFDDVDVREFEARVRRFLKLAAEAPLAFTAEPKIDGLSLNLRYEKDALKLAATRGDGAVGENVGKGYKDLQGIIGGWMDSSGHRSTLLSQRFVEFGLAVARGPGGKLYWAMIAGGSFEAWQG